MTQKEFMAESRRYVLGNQLGGFFFFFFFSKVELWGFKCFCFCFDFI